jgi:hypothetical protein
MNITDAAFANLAGIHTLDMSFCNQGTITDAAFAHLAGIHTLKMGVCNQPAITDAAFANLRGIHTLSMNYCSQPTITDAAFSYLAGIHSLHMRGGGAYGLQTHPPSSRAAHLRIYRQQKGAHTGEQATPVGLQPPQAGHQVLRLRKGQVRGVRRHPHPIVH